MIQSNRCRTCAGSGQMMGGGMLIKDCHVCFGKGKIDEPNEDIDYLVAKQTESYKSAKKRLKTKYKDLSDKEAEELLDDALEKEKSKK